MAIDYNVFYSKKGKGYRKEQIVDWSAYDVPIDTRPGRLAGNSRIWGDASHEVQRKVIDAIIAAAKADGFTVRRMAMLLAMAKIESGFNPDAAAGTTSAAGLGQFVKKTGEAFGLNPQNRFEIGPSIKALIGYFKENEAIALKKKKPDYFVYKYHHDGPFGEYGGTQLATDKFAPLAAIYEKALIAGHVLTILDPSGQAIAGAEIRIAQNDKSAVLKTNEHGMLPTFMASPDFGPIAVYIKKVDGTFKYLADLAIDKLESAWTLVAPKDRVPLKTHLHEPKAGVAAPAPGMHKVEPGETVSRIARDHGTTYQELCKLNGIEKPYVIQFAEFLETEWHRKALRHFSRPDPETADQEGERVFRAGGHARDGSPSGRAARKSRRQGAARSGQPASRGKRRGAAFRWHDGGHRLRDEACPPEVATFVPEVRQARVVCYEDDPHVSGRYCGQGFRTFSCRRRVPESAGDETGDQSRHSAGGRRHHLSPG